MMDPSPTLPLGRQQGRTFFADLIRQTLNDAQTQGWADWWWCDADFADWPLGERAVVDSLNAWARSGRRLRLLAKDYRSVQILHARFVRWRVTWDHLIEVRACSGASEQDFPSAMWTPNWVFQRTDRARSVVLCSGDAQDRLLLQQSLREWWARSTPAFPASVLGL